MKIFEFLKNEIGNKLNWDGAIKCDTGMHFRVNLVVLKDKCKVGASYTGKIEFLGEMSKDMLEILLR